MEIPRRDRARLYALLAQLVAAGVPPTLQIDTLERTLGGAAVRVLLRRVREEYTAGNPLSAAMLRSEDLGLPRFHGRLVAAAERGGDVAGALRRLAGQDQRVEATRQALRRGAAYPVLVFHLAVISGGGPGFVLAPASTVLAILLIVGPVDVALLLTARVLSRPRALPRLASALRLLPPIDRVVRDEAAAAYFGTLHQLYEAGIPLLTAADEATDAVAHPDVHAEYRAALAAGTPGERFHERVARLPLDRPEVVGALVVGEVSGTLGEALREQSRLLDEWAVAAQSKLVKRTLLVLYVGALAYAAIRVLVFWSGYFGQFSGGR